MTDVDRAKLAAMAHKLRTGRRYDPNELTTSRLEDIRDSNLRLAQALGSENAHRQPAKLTHAEQREVDRIVGDNPTYFAAPTPASDRNLDHSDGDRETARMLRELGLDR